MSAKPAQVSQPRDYKLIVEKDVQIPMRDGTLLYADVFRPDGGDERLPAIMNISVYQKDKLWVPPADLEEEAQSLHELGDGQSDVVVPARLCLRARRLARLRQIAGQVGAEFVPGGAWISTMPSNGSRSAPWCSGNIGTLGISYHASSQWRVANLQPPSLKAIMPWEGRADQYRDQAYHGGIFALGFIGNWWLTHTAHHLLGRPRSYNPDAFHNDMMWNYMRNDLDSEYWRMSSARWDKITVPLYSVGNWGGFSMHLRGNTEGYMNAASKHKKLRIHTGTHFHPFHSEEGRMDQLRWFDYWLKGIDTGIMDEPPVKLEIRTGGSTERYRVPLRERMAARAHAVDQDVSAKSTASRRAMRRRVEGELEHDAARRTKPGSATPRSGVDQGRRGVGLVARHHARQHRAHRRVVRDRAARAGHRGHRTDRAQPVGVEHVRGHGHLRRRCATSAPTARTSAKSASTASRCRA